jgi:hypothetical protein
MARRPSSIEPSEAVSTDFLAIVYASLFLSGSIY